MEHYGPHEEAAVTLPVQSREALRQGIALQRFVRMVITVTFPVN